jgi:hypothetical protein
VAFAAEVDNNPGQQVTYHLLVVEADQ